MLHLAFSIFVLLLAALPTLLIIRNFPLFQFPSKESEAVVERPGVSLLIPARNEAAGIEATLTSVLASHYQSLEVIVLDDHSEDETAAIVNRLAVKDDRLRLEQSKKLPEGWNGKQHACWQLAEHAKHDLLLFLDADVHVQPVCVHQLAQLIQQRDLDLLSGFPKQILGTLSERMLIPMMYYVLLGYLPLDQMRANNDPKFGAGCGQLFLARRKAYFDAGGHKAIHGSRHDGLKLPRSFRAAGFSSDLVDASHLAEVRMYEGWPQVRNGLLKNATEGFANWKLIPVFTVLLIGGSVLPLLGLAHALFWGWPAEGTLGITATFVLATATAVNWVGAFCIQGRMKHPLVSAVLHPVAVAAFMLLQWTALMREQLGMQPIAWRGRA
ncbi:MAG: glycosyltransferase family 2 protein [Planctomycetota bacterium]|nr:glycosyltransferase family 2 protein [Planctomycetota bacterium]